MNSIPNNIRPAMAAIKPVRIRFSAAFSRAMVSMDSCLLGAACVLSAPLSSSSVDTPKSSLRAIILDISGAASFSYHFETDWRETSSCSASCSCERPAALRSCCILSPTVISFIARVLLCGFVGHSIPRKEAFAPPIILGKRATGGCGRMSKKCRSATFLKL